METAITAGTLIALTGMITGCYVWVSKHINDRDRHPLVKDIVFKDVCDVRHEASENAAAVLTARIDEIREDIKEEFKEVKALIRNGHAK